MSAIILSLLVTGVALAVPLLLAALGELVVERSGVINVGIEGMVLAGAFAGYAGASAFHTPWIGLLFALGAGTALASIAAAATVVMGRDQVVVGTAINLLAAGITSVLFRGMGNESSSAVPSFAEYSVPLLSQIPWVGKIFFQQNVFGYLAWILVPMTSIWLNRTRAGLILRSAGEYPAATDAAGASVQAVRFGAFLFGGGLAGLAGAFLSIGYNNGFVENMSAGRGFIALAVVILGRWSPLGILGASLFFGVATSLQFQFQAAKTVFPYQFFLALPYILTLGALLLRINKSAGGAPLSLGESYQRN